MFILSYLISQKKGERNFMKLFHKIAVAFVGASMAMGVGVAIAGSSGEAIKTDAVSSTSNLVKVTSSSTLSTAKKYVYATALSGTIYYLTNDDSTSGWGGYTTDINSATEWSVSSADSGDFHLTDGTLNVSALTSNSFSYITSKPGNSNRSALNSSGNLINKTTTARNLRYNGSGATKGFRWYGNTTTGTEAFLYEVSTGFGTLDHIKVGTPATKLSYEVGETFSSAGLILTGYDAANEATANTTTYSSGYTTNYDSHTFVAEDIGNKTVTVTYSGKTTTYTITIGAAPDFVHTYAENSVYNQTSASTSEERTYTPSSGPEYITLGGYNYSGNGGCMSFTNSNGMYLGNNSEYIVSANKKYISKMVITTSGDYHSYLTMTEGPAALSTAATVTPVLTDSNKTLTYTFSGENAFFKLAKSGTGYVNLTSIKVYLGATIEDAVVSSVEIETPSSVYVGKTLQLNATVHYSNKADDHKVTWRVSSGSGATVDDSGLVTATNNTTTTIEAKSVEKNNLGQQVAATVTITPLANPIVSVAWNTSAAKKSYNVGESLDISGVTATGTNAAGDNDIAIELTASNFSGFDSSAPVNSQTITVSYLTFSTTYTIRVVTAPDVYIEPTDFGSGGYDINNDGLTFDGIFFDVYRAYQNSGIQIDKTNGQFHNTEPLGLYITSVEISVKTNTANVYLGNSELTTNSGLQSEAVASGDGVTVITPDANTYQYIRITATSSYCQLNYVKIWYAPFVPTVTLDETSFEFTQGESGEIEVNATASHFTNNNNVTFSAVSSDQSVLADGDINEDDGYFLISKSDINPGTTTVTVTGTYLTEEATASFTITCDAAARNLLSISITTPSSDVEFEKGAKFTISSLVVTGTFDAAPLTADVTDGCTFKIGDTSLTPGTSVLNTAGSFTVKVSHANSAAAETLQYTISVVEASTLTITQSDIGDAFAYADTNVSSFDIALNNALNSTVDLESYGLYKNGTTIQMNTGKGTYIKNTLAVPGRILRIEMEWSNGTTKNSPTIYFGNSYFNSKPISGGTQATVGSSNSVSANGDYSYFYLDGTTVSGSCQMTEMRVIYIANDKGAAMNFADKYLHMNDYDFGGVHGSTNGDGSCETYYGTAATAYGKLTGEQKLEFSKLSAAVARMTDWAARNGYTFDANAGTLTQNSRVNTAGISFDNNNNVVAIIAIVSAISIITIGAYFLLKKKHA